MLKPKKKMTKQDLKEDKFVKAALQAKTYFDENSRQVTMLVLGIFAVVAIFIIYNYTSKEGRIAANGQLGIAQIEFSNGNYDKATVRLQKLIDKHSGSDAALQGTFLLANIYFQQKDYDDARHYFQVFIENYSGSNILLASGYAGLAACYEIDNDFMQAAELYDEAADLTTDFTESDNYCYLAGICYKKAGQFDKAKNQFKKLVDDSKSGLRAKDAESQLVLLNAF
jgi:tetratricopeptide (TPR) repeat protein